MQPKRTHGSAGLAVRCPACLFACAAVLCTYSRLEFDVNLVLYLALTTLSLAFSVIIPNLIVAVFATLFFTGFIVLAAGVHPAHASAHTSSFSFHWPGVDRYVAQQVFDVAISNSSGPKKFADFLAVAKRYPNLSRGDQVRNNVDTQSRAVIDDHAGVPDLEGLMRRMMVALRPFQHSYLKHLGEIKRVSCSATYSEKLEGNFLPGCPSSAGCISLETLEEALEECAKHEDCGGVTRVAGSDYQIRKSSYAEGSPIGEASWLKQPCPGETAFERATPVALWSAFAKVMDAALEDPTLRLNGHLQPPRDDDSIFLSVSSYRDDNCPFTVRQALERADHPEKVNIGIVQINCESATRCKWSTGWADTRRIIDRPGADKDCLKEFCASPFGAPHCSAGRIRIVRLTEALALGPFFTRYINAKLWRGETFYMQVDAHIGFRSSWDTSIVRQMKKTPSYPMSIISNYPPQGSPKAANAWPPATSAPRHAEEALCDITFESVPGHQRKTVRLQHTMRYFDPGAHGDDASRPRHVAFVAAGFFIAHASILEKVPFDPFMPFLFMGEEIALSIRFWTAGYDIYGPVDAIVNHDYGRHEAPKFWETVDMVFGAPGTYNDINNLLVQRVQHLVGMPEAATESDVTQANPSILLRAKEFGLGSQRTGEEFARHMGIDWAKHRQQTPNWCVTGVTPPWVKSIGR